MPPIDRLLPRSALLWITLLGLLSCGAEQSLAREPEVDLVEQNASANYYGTWKEKMALADLPERVVAPEGKLTLWADFDHPDDSGVPMYLVNRTSQDFTVQGGATSVRLEYLAEDGTWKRGQAYRAPECGCYSGIGPPVLSPQQFYLFHGYQVSQGKPCKVRYVWAHDDTVSPSQEGEGFVSEEDLKAVAHDSFSERLLPDPFMEMLRMHYYEFKKSPAANDASLSGVFVVDPVRLAQRMEVVRVLPYVERNEVALHWVRLLRDKLEDAPQDETIRTALRTIDDVLTHAWQSPLPPDFYLKLCVASVTGAPSPDPKVPLLREAFAWEGIGGFVIRGTVGHDPDMWQPKIWKPVIAAAVRHVEEGKQFGLYSRNLLENHRLLDTYVSNADLVEWLKSPSEIILKLAAHTLARREAYQRLAEAASQAHLTASQEALVLKELAYSGGEEGSQTAREPATYQPSPELEFWKHCLSEEPLEAAAALWEGGSFGAQSRKPFSWWMHGPVRASLAEEAAHGGAGAAADFDLGEQKAKKLASAIHFLSAWKRPNDIAVLAKLQGHRGYWVETTVTYPPAGGKETHRDRRYVVREAAAEDLREIPPGPVTNDEPEELPSPAEPVPGVLPPIEPPQK